MNLIPIEAATAEMVLADDLRRTNCLPLLAAGTRLDEVTLVSLRERGVSTLSVQSGPAAGAADQAALRERIFGRLSFLFRHNATDVTSQALFRAVFEYRTGSP